MLSLWFFRLPNAWAWRCNEGGLVQGMKLVCLGYYRNSRVKPQAKPSFPLLLLPSLIVRARPALNLL